MSAGAPVTHEIPRLAVAPNRATVVRRSGTPMVPGHEDSPPDERRNTAGGRVVEFDMDGPNPFRAAWSVLWARRVRRPDSVGDGTVDHSAFAPILQSLRGPNRLATVDRPSLDGYTSALQQTDPRDLSAAEGLAFWINLYNAKAIALAAEALLSGRSSVLRVPGAFDRRVVDVAGEALSLNDVEHGKIRRYRDPRIHGSLVCGSLSCPTLRYEPFTGVDLDGQLAAQMQTFVQSGAVAVDRTRGVISLSRIFLWYGSDFVRPHRMPTLLPAGKRAVAVAAARHLDDETAARVSASNPRVEFQGYDWALGCSVA